MGSRRDTLNAAQLEALRWVADGSPEGVMTGTTHKLSCNALRNRGLVTISKRGGVWSAAITTLGTEVLKSGAMPRTPLQARGKQPTPVPRTRTPLAQPEHVDTQALVSRIEAEGGTLVLSEARTYLTPARRAGYRAAIREVNRRALAGPNLGLRSLGLDRGDLVLRIVPRVDPSTLQPSAFWTDGEVAEAAAFIAGLRQSRNAVLVPPADVTHVDRLVLVANSAGLLNAGEALSHYERWWGEDRNLGTIFSIRQDAKQLVSVQPVTPLLRVTRFSPAVSWYRTERDRQEVSDAHLSRAALILETIAREAGRRGWELRTDTSHEAGSNRRIGPVRLAEGQFRVAVVQREYWLRIREKSAPGQTYNTHSPNDRRPAWLRQRSHLFVPTGILQIETSFRTIVDGARSRVEERLPDLFAAIEGRHLADQSAELLQQRVDELRIEARKRRAADLRREWEEARAQAEASVHEARRVDALLDQIGRFELVGRIDRLIEAANAGAGVEPAWLTWIEAYRDRISPLATQLTAPDHAPVTATDLAPHMQGLDPKGPAEPR